MKKCFILLFAIIILWLPVNATADNMRSGTCGNGIQFVIENATLTISGTGVIDSMTEYGVPWKDSVATIERVVIQEGITKIGDHAFQYHTSLTEAVLPDSLRKIGTGAFLGCKSLSAIDIPQGVTEIGDFAFAECMSVSSLTLPDSVKVVGYGAFSDCISLCEITLPDSIERIKDCAFYGTEYYVDSKNRENGLLYIGNHLIAASGAIVGDYVIKEGTLTISDYAFFNCIGLTGITGP